MHICGRRRYRLASPAPAHGCFCSRKNLFGQPWPRLLQNLIIQESPQAASPVTHRPRVLLRSQKRVLTATDLRSLPHHSEEHRPRNPPPGSGRLRKACRVACGARPSSRAPQRGRARRPQFGHQGGLGPADQVPPKPARGSGWDEVLLWDHLSKEVPRPSGCQRGCGGQEWGR